MNLNLFHTLVLNSGWLPIGITSYKKALICLNSDNAGNLVSKALDINYKLIGDNTWDFEQVESINPLSFDEWIKLPVRPFDSFVKTINKTIRLPTVIVSLGFSKMPLRQMKPTRKAILERDNYICQYSGVKLPKNALSVDHIQPKSKSGKEDWLNLVACDKSINAKKGNKSNEEAGLTLIKAPKKPLPLPASALIREIKHKDWTLFIKK